LGGNNGQRACKKGVQEIRRGQQKRRGPRPGLKKGPKRGGGMKKKKTLSQRKGEEEGGNLRGDPEKKKKSPRI